jgi:hypothetical protein
MNDLIGLKVIYTSASNREYEATIYGLPTNPYHAEGRLPTVSLEFRDERGKLKKFERCLHVGNCSLGKTQKWRFKKP